MMKEMVDKKISVDFVLGIVECDKTEVNFWNLFEAN